MFLPLISVLAKTGQSVSIEAVAKAVNGRYDNIKQLLSRMCRDGLIERPETGLDRMPKTQSDLPI